jgi:alpha-L-fucosidase
VTKHHDGYALWPSAVTNPQQADWFSERDLVGELATAVRKRGMRFGTYYSTGLDWSFNLVAEGDLVEDVMRSAPPGEAYGDYVFDQMSELIERYQPDLLWADIGYPTEGRLGELLQSYFAQVPDGVVNDRWGGVDALGKIAAIPGAASVMKALARWMVKNADPLADDPARIGFKTAEYASLPGISPFKWESTRGLGASFAYNTEEIPEDRLTAQELVHFLVDTVAKNGNVLINVGPDSYGMIPDEQQAPLSGLGNWLQGNGEAIYGSKPWIREANTRGRELRYTTKDNALYAIVFGDVEQTFTIEHPGDSWTKVEVLGANVQDSQSRDGMLQISLDRELAGPAVVVKLSE